MCVLEMQRFYHTRRKQLKKKECEFVSLNPLGTKAKG